jgi:hypothetical protein
LLAAALLAAGAALGCAPAAAQEQNKVIVKDFKWKVFSTAHFDVYYYPGSEPWLSYASGVLEEAWKREGADLNPAIAKRIPFFLYGSIDDMEQTNVADVSDGIGGLTEPYKDRFMAWSDGSRGWLRDVIDHEFAHELQFSVLIDGFWKSARILKTFVYPLWMMEGMAEYETGMQDFAMEKMYVRDAALSGGLIPLSRLNQFGHLKPHQITLAYKTGAQAIRFLAEQYGADKPRKMLELFRTRYEAGTVLQPLIGLDMERFEKKFAEYTELKYLAEAKRDRLEEPSIYGAAVTAQSGGIPEFNVSPAPSPDGGRVAWVSTRDGYPPQVRVRDLATGRETKLDALSAGAENIPYGRFTLPLRSLAWSPDGKYLAFSGQKNHREYLYLYEPGSGKVIRTAVEGFTELRQPAFSPDGATVAFVGMRDAFNDLYEVPAARLAEGGTVPYSAVSRLTDSAQDEASPAYSPDGGTLAYSCEIETSSGPARALCLLPRGGKPRVVQASPGSVIDPVFSGDGSTVYFVSDTGYDYDLYAFDAASGLSRRLTRSLGGAFTPAAGGGKLWFSAFRRGGMDVYAARPENFLYEKPEGEPLKAETGFEVAPASGTVNPYKFKASTDLFFPAFLFSSPGGIFWMNYWQASDMLGNNNLSVYLNYNSGANYLTLTTSYSYARYRMPLLLQSSEVTYDDGLDSAGFSYDKRYARHAVGTAWPFDRYNRLQGFLIVKDETNRYTDVPVTERYRTRALQTSYVRDTVTGLYLTANRGSRTELSWEKAADMAGGNLRYDAYTLQYLKYLPLSKRSAFVNRFTSAFSTGRDRRDFDFGGLGGLRGFSGSSDRYDKSGVFMDNAELRVPLFKDLNYYMWYMFPDFYFKALYGKLFADSAYGWNDPAELRSFNGGRLKTSVGAGVDVHTFLLQEFQLVLSFDYAVRMTDGGKIFYFYLGPMF